MVWQEGVTQIIMLTNLNEGGKVGRSTLHVAVFTINMHDRGMGEKSLDIIHFGVDYF